jgi:hypothetical protein
MEYRWEDWMGDDGERGVFGVVVHYVCAAEGIGDRGIAVGELDACRVFCKSAHRMALLAM